MEKETNIDQAFVLQLRQALGANIKEKRTALNMDQSALGHAIGVTYSTISKIESGKFPTAIDTYLKIGIALNFKIEFNDNELLILNLKKRK